MKHFQPLLTAAALAFSVPATVSALPPESANSPKLPETGFTVTFKHSAEEFNWLEVDTSRAAPLISVSINGTQVCGLIDTGAARTVIDLDFARAQGLTVVQTDIKANTNSAPIALSRAKDVSVEVPGQFQFTSDLLAIDIADYQCPDASRLGFVLGMEILKKVAFAYNPDKQLVLFTPSGKINPRRNNFIGLDWSEERVVGEVDGQPARLKVDTGSNSMLLVPIDRFDTLFAQKSLQPMAGAIDAAGRKENEVGVRGVKLEIAGFVLNGDAKRVSASDGTLDAKLGFPFFRNTYTIFDAGRSLILMRKAPHGND